MKKENKHPKESLIGRKVKGFWFQNEKYNGLPYAPLMYGYIGEVGEIKKYHSFDNSYRVEFKESSWDYPAELIEQHLVKEHPKKSLIGRKVKGFKFKSEKDFPYNVVYISEIDKQIGKIGEIHSYNWDYHSYQVRFGDMILSYPADLIEQHLVEENPLDSLPMLGEGVLCWVEDDNTAKCQIFFSRYVCARTPKGYVAWDNGIKDNIVNWKYARPIEPVKQYTKEQLEEIVGHKFELIKQD